MKESSIAEILCGMISFRWFKKFIRRHTLPIHEDKAVDWKKRLSIMYAVIAWNAFGYVCYMMFTGKADWAKYYGYKTEDDEMSTAARWSPYYYTGTARVYRIHGFSSIEDRGILENDKVEK